MMGRYPHIARFAAPSAADWKIVREVMEKSEIVEFGDRYVTELSGGERQRVVFARALAQKTAVLILDEATSALDTESENHIQTNMRKILKDRTAVIIAHRLSTIMNANRILVLYDGAIVEEGTHQELLDRQGMYFHLIQRQISGGGDN